jgi:TRAP-type C4-dicarboxylate transport system permease small subunit
MNSHSRLIACARTIAIVENLLLAVILLLIILLAVIQILLRNLFDTSFFWIDPFNRLMVLWLAILGAMVATREREHISIDIIQHYVKGVFGRILLLIGNVFAAFVCLLMSYHSGRFVYLEYLDGIQTFSSLPAWPFELILPLGMFVIAVRFLFAIAKPDSETAE